MMWKKRILAIFAACLLVLAGISAAGTPGVSAAEPVENGGEIISDEIILTPDVTNGADPSSEDYLALTASDEAVLIDDLEMQEEQEGSAQEEPGIVLAECSDDVSSLLDPLTCEEGEQIVPVTIDPTEGTAIVAGGDGKELLQDVYALSEEENTALTGGSEEENREAVLDYLLEDPCIVREQEDGTLRAAYPFAFKILFVLSEPGMLEDSFGAVNAVYDLESERYVLQYDSQEAAAQAYGQLTGIFGSENILIDLPVTPEEIRYDESKNDQTYSHYTENNKSLSWGNDVMYLDRLRDWANANPADGTLKVAVLDGGIRVDETNENIIDGYGIDASRILTNYCQAIVSSICDYSAWYDYSESGWQSSKHSYADLKGHGTHVISTILDGTPDNVKAFAIRVSNAYPMKANSSKYSYGDIDGLIKGVKRAGDLRAKVVNISQGIDCYDSGTGIFCGYYGKGMPDMENITMETFAYYNNELAKYAGNYDMCIVVSAGNDGEDINTEMHFPAMNNGVIAVSNLLLQGGIFSLYEESNYGDNVSFCAPGCNIVGAGYNWSTHRACYVSKSGTSMAAPHIAAALAMIRLYYPEMSNAEAVDFLKEFCKDLGDPGKDNKYGYGFPQFKTMLSMTLVYNDSSTGNLKVTIPKGMPFPEPEDPERKGYTFGGWYTDSACTNAYDFSAPVKSNGTLYAKWKKIAVQGISLNKTDLELTCNKTATLTATVTPSDAADKTVTWSSSNPAVATVNSSGVVKAKTYGKATITAKTSNGKKATCVVQTRFTDAVRGKITSTMFDAIYWAADTKITTEKVKFKTEEFLTRGQFVRFLYRYAGEPAVTSSMIKKYGKQFKDVDSSYTHFKAIVWAVSKGLIDGYSDGTFKPKGTLTKNNVATILWKFAGKPKVKNPNNPFTDVKKSVAIAWGKSKKIFTGTRFYPKTNCTRGVFAIYLYRYDKR